MTTRILADFGDSGGDFGGEPCGVVGGVAFTHPAGDQYRARRYATGVQAVGRQLVKGDVHIGARHVDHR
jgi:hypothetical protein